MPNDPTRQDPPRHAPVRAPGPARPGFHISTASIAVLVVCAVLTVALAYPGAIARSDAERSGYFFGVGAAAIGMPLLAGWLTHRLGSRPDVAVIIVALLCLVSRGATRLRAAGPALEARP
jgi:hypothetical protein